MEIPAVVKHSSFFLPNTVVAIVLAALNESCLHLLGILVEAQWVAAKVSNISWPTVMLNHDPKRLPIEYYSIKFFLQM
jgi:hypothetical protein